MKIRNIAIFFDGTGQSKSQQKPVDYTNVVLLHDALDMTKTLGVSQGRKYIEGVGTRKEESLKGGAWGIGLDERIEEAYAYLWQEYNNAKDMNAEPHVFLFGFSRGAYAARWLASLIVHAGIPKDENDVRKLFKLHRSGKWNELKKIKDDNRVWLDAAIDYIGLWDTVEASVNKSFDIENAHPSVKSVRHALAMDEWRFKFLPTRYIPREGVEELWFPGCHTDVGGGYPERGLARRPLEWIAEGAIKAGLVVDIDKLNKFLDERSSEIKFHDELVDGGWEMDVLWWLTNICGGLKNKIYREMGTDDYYDISYLTYEEQAPVAADRLHVPSSCLVYESSRLTGVNKA